MASNADDSERVGARTSIYKRKKTWYVNYQEGGQQIRHSLKTTNKVLARQKAGEIERRLQEGTLSAVPQEFPVTRLVEEYEQSLVTDDRSAKTRNKYHHVLKLFLALLGEEHVKYVHQIRPRHVQAYRTLRARKGRQPKTIYNETVILLQLMKFAKRMDYIANEPLKGFRNPEPKPTRQPCWSREEVEQILARVTKPLDQLALTILADTGLRCGELEWLTWDDLDWANDMIRIRPKEGWTTKTGNQRSVPMSERLRRLLKNEPQIARWVISRPESEPEEERRRLNPRSLLTTLKRIVNALGLTGHLHTFRHSFVSDALMNSVPETVVREWVGHIDPEILKIYSHVTVQHSRQFMNRLSEVRGSAAQSPDLGKEPADVTQSDSAQNQHTA